MRWPIKIAASLLGQSVSGCGGTEAPLGVVEAGVQNDTASEKPEGQFQSDERKQGSEKYVAMENPVTPDQYASPAMSLPPDSSFFVEGGNHDVSPKEEMPETEEACYSLHALSLNLTLNRFQEGWHLYKHDGDYLVSDSELGQWKADYLLKKLSLFSKGVLAFFNIDSPYWEGMILQVFSDDYYYEICPRHSIGCAFGGAVTLRDDFLNPNQSDALDHLLWHEASHAVRMGVMGMTGICSGETNGPSLEEGLATYTAYHLHDAVPMMPLPRATRIFEGRARFDDLVQLNYEARPWLNFRLSPLDDETVLLTYNDDGDLFSRSVPLGTHYLVDHIIHVVQEDPAHLQVVLWRRGEGWNRSFGSLVRCDETARAPYRWVATEGGNIRVNSPEIPYRENLTDYYTQFCFWDTIREQNGHQAVQRILQSMAEFSKNNQQWDSTPSSQFVFRSFPFFETVMDVTGMKEEEAREFFGRFGARTDDLGYLVLGRVCWDRMGN